LFVLACSSIVLHFILRWNLILSVLDWLTADADLMREKNTAEWLADKPAE